jgi:hypothetical protein
MQTYNRYSYVRNNPLKYTDPSGHSFWSIIKTLIVVAIVAAVSYAVLLHGFGLTAAMVKTGLAIGSQYVLSAVMVSGAIAGFVGGVAGALLDGASPSQAFIAGLTGFVMGGLTAGISNAIGKMSNILARSISHGIVGGIRAIIQGGNFLSGFMSSFASTVLQPIGAAIAKGNYYARATFSALVGGTVSVIGGGKFANGAVTSAFQFMYNDWLHEKEGSFIKTFRKARDGLLKLGDYLARKSGFRDWQEGSIVVPSYYRDQAIREEMAMRKLSQYALKYPKLTIKAYEAYNEYTYEQLKVDTIVKGYSAMFIKTGGIPFILSATGNILGQAHILNVYIENLLSGTK